MPELDTEELAAAEAAVAEEEQHCREHPAYFIENYVTIEDKLHPEGRTIFRLWKEQADAIAAFLVYRMVLGLKARQLGYTWLVLAYAVWRMLTIPGFTAAVVSKTDDDAMELVDFRLRIFIMPNLPAWWIRPRAEAPPGWTGLTWDCTMHELAIYHPNGMVSRFKADAGPNAARSLTANLVILDEWAANVWAREIWAAGYPTVNRPGTSPLDGQVIIISTGKVGTLFEEQTRGAQRQENSFFLIFWPWWTDPRRTPEWYRQTQANMPTIYRSEYPANIDEAFTVGQGAFFPEWDTEAHLPADFPPGWQPPKQWLRYRAYDGGYSSRACCKWYAQRPDGRLVAYREYYPQQVADDTQAREIARMSTYPDGSAEVIVYTVADPACWGKQSTTGQTTAEVFALSGVPLTRGDNTLPAGWRQLHQWLQVYTPPEGGKAARLQFTRDCLNTIRTYPGCEQKKTNPEDISDQSEHHPQDCDRYMIMSRPFPGAGQVHSPSTPTGLPAGFDPLASDKPDRRDWTEV